MVSSPQKVCGNEPSFFLSTDTSAGHYWDKEGEWGHLLLPSESQSCPVQEPLQDPGLSFGKNEMLEVMMDTYDSQNTFNHTIRIQRTLTHRSPIKKYHWEVQGHLLTLN